MRDKNILAFDPGHLTGISAINSSGKLVIALTVPHETLLVNQQFFTALQRLAQPQVVLVESLPSSHVDRITSEVHARIVHWYSIAGIEVVGIQPGWWKPMIDRIPIPGTHITDAYTMARWYLGKEGIDG